LHYIQEIPDAISYVPSYYRENWGFCISYDTYRSLKEGDYEVVIDSSLTSGSMTYGDLVLKGSTDREIVLSTYTCHPSMANNELSGVLVLAFLYQEIEKIKNKKITYRFVFAPETIGAINYLHENGKYLKEKVDAGFILTCVGDDGKFNYKSTRRENTLTNRVTQHVLESEGIDYNSLTFRVLGSDERQYASPGFNLPIGALTRSIYHFYTEYHTSKDDKSFISFSAMEKTIHLYLKIMKALELNELFFSQNPFCEPQLGKRGLYHELGGVRNHPKQLLRTMQLLNYADGEHDLISIANMTEDSIFDYQKIVESLLKHKLIDYLKMRNDLSNYPNIEAIFLGKMDNKEVMKWYEKNKVDVFLSVSETEGLPVSMMEAISFGIQIVSTNVGGCNEIVTKDTGYLVDPNLDYVEVRNRITEIKNGKFSSVEEKKIIFQHWEENFSMNKNMKRFISDLSY